MTKSKRTTIKLLICVLAVIALSTVLVACNTGNKPAHYDHLVTFDYNTGNLSANTPTQYLGVDNNSLVSIRPGYSSQDFPERSVEGYYLEGWYLPLSIGEDGTPETDENGFVKLGAKWDFKTQRVTEDITLYGNFKKKPAIRFKDTATDEYIEGVNTYIEGVPGQTLYKPVSATAPKVNGYTFLGKYYTTKDADKEFVWPHVFKEDDPDLVVYVSFLEGEWVFVSKTTEFLSAVRANQNVYLEADLDFTNYGTGNNKLYPGTYKGEINGNGHFVKGLKATTTAAKVDYDSRVDCFSGLFSVLGSEANIHDIEFRDVEFTFAINRTYLSMDAYIGLLAGRAEQGAKVNNVTISGTLTWTKFTNKTIYIGEGNSLGVIGDNKINPSDYNCNSSGITVTEKQ